MKVKYKDLELASETPLYLRALRVDLMRKNKKTFFLNSNLIIPGIEKEEAESLINEYKNKYEQYVEKKEGDVVTNKKKFAYQVRVLEKKYNLYYL